jgi:DNA-binding NarL/FixJ family response regulator
VRKLNKLPQWLLRVAMDNFPASAAILDESGIILYVNEAGRLFAGEHGLADEDYGVGKSYLDLCQAMLDQESPEKNAVVARLQQVMKNRQGEVCLEFACSFQSKRQWHRVCATRLDPSDSRQSFKVLVVHQEITQQKRAEEKSQELSGHLINAQEQKRQGSERLIARQREVVQLLAEGRSMKEIASMLNITTRTVAYHKYTVMEQYQIKTSAGLIQFAIKNHLVSV